MLRNAGCSPNQKRENEATDVFGDTAIKIWTQGQKHLGAVLGSRSYLEEYTRGKVEDWVEQVAKLVEFAAAIKPHMQPLLLD